MWECLYTAEDNVSLQSLSNTCEYLVTIVIDPSLVGSIITSLNSHSNKL